MERGIRRNFQKKKERLERRIKKHRAEIREIRKTQKQKT